MKTVDGLFYSKTHEWVKLEGNTATVGLTDYAVTALGGVVFVELPEVDAALSQEEEMATVESVKAVSPVYSPVAGTVTEVNTELEENPELLNDDPYGAWFCKMSVEEGATDGLLDAAAYEAFCATLD